jgi:hypothetical protein
MRCSVDVSGKRKRRPAEERIAEAITRFTGRRRFVYLHLAFFGFGTGANQVAQLLGSVAERSPGKYSARPLSYEAQAGARIRRVPTARRHDQSGRAS